MKWITQYKRPKKLAKAVEKLRKTTQVAFYTAVRDLEKQGPHPKEWDTKKLKGRADEYRLKLDRSHRMIYSALHRVLTIEIIEVVTRENAYK